MDVNDRKGERIKILNVMNDRPEDREKESVLTCKSFLSLCFIKQQEYVFLSKDSKTLNFCHVHTKTEIETK